MRDCCLLLTSGSCEWTYTDDLIDVATTICTHLLAFGYCAALARQHSQPEEKGKMQARKWDKTRYSLPLLPITSARRVCQIVQCNLLADRRLEVGCREADIQSTPGPSKTSELSRLPSHLYSWSPCWIPRNPKRQSAQANAAALPGCPVPRLRHKHCSAGTAGVGCWVGFVFNMPTRSHMGELPLRVETPNVGTRGTEPRDLGAGNVSPDWVHGLVWHPCLGQGVPAVAVGE